MDVTVNFKTVSVGDDASVRDLLAELNVGDKGIAVAVNNEIVKKDEWNGFRLKENDKIVIIRAACGG